MTVTMKKTEEEWKSLLTEEQYRITRLKGTERPFTGMYYDHKEAGIYFCVCCGKELFSSEAKYESGSGWPSYWKAIADENLTTAPDTSHNKVRVELMCSTCGAHLGHIFDDGPQPTGLRYCINSASLHFQPEKK